MRRSTSPEVVEQIKSLRSEGVSIRSVAERLRVSVKTVQKYQGTKDQGNPGLGELIYRIQVLRVAGISRPEVAGMLGISSEVVKKYDLDQGALEMLGVSW